MVDRAAIIVTDADYVFASEVRLEWTAHGVNLHGSEACSLDASPELLEDLWNLVDECEALDIPHLRNAAARVRALLPKEGEGE